MLSDVFNLGIKADFHQFVVFFSRCEAIRLDGALINYRHECDINPFRTKTPKYLFPRGNEPLLYHQIGNRNFFIFIANK